MFVFKKFYKFLLIILFFSIGFDQMTKVLSENNLMTYSEPDDLTLYKGKKFPIFNHEQENLNIAINFNYVRNLGAAWGSLAKVSDHIRIPFFYAVTIIAIIVIGFFFVKTPENHRFPQIALTLILSGALGNALDRLRLGYVIDWIDVRWSFYGWSYNFPNFNFADIAISVGFIMMIIDATIFDLLRAKSK